MSDLYVLNIVFDEKAKRNFAKNFILDFLKNREVETLSLDTAAKKIGISKNTLNRAKTELIKQGEINYRNEGFGKSKRFFTYALKDGGCG